MSWLNTFYNLKTDGGRIEMEEGSRYHDFPDHSMFSLLMYAE